MARRPLHKFPQKPRSRACLLSMATGLIGLSHPSYGQVPLDRATLPRNSDGQLTPLSSEKAIEQTWALHAQGTFVVQSNPAFRSAFEGANSLRARGETRETTDVTLFLGVKPWAGAELWANPEIDQGFGLANTVGAAGFPSGEAYKVGKANPYFRLQRLFFRQTIQLGGAIEKVTADLNQLGSRRRADRLVVTVGKISVGDIFDTNRYAHDPRADFLNWTLIDAGSFDYAADAWGYSYGGAIELYRRGFALRAGLFNLSKVPNSETLERNFSQYELVVEGEAPLSIGGRPGKLKLTGFINHGNMGRFTEAVALAGATGQAADIGPVRRFATRSGMSINIEQAVTGSLGVFARAGRADGRFESFEFTDVDRTIAGGVSLNGKRWGREGDTIGLAGVINCASADRKAYLNAGGLGILVGDGELPRPGDEHIVETYYNFAPFSGINLTADVQFINNPAYNRDRGPVVVLGARLHGQF